MPRKTMDVRCVVCGAMFSTRPRPKRPIAKHCSKRCIWAGTRGPEFNARIARMTVKDRADRQRRTGRGDGYVKRDGRHEHRVVAEKMLGRKLRSDEIVHHTDGDKQNNDPSNLEVMTQAEHMREHGLGIKGMSLPWEPWKYRGKKKTKAEGS